MIIDNLKKHTKKYEIIYTDPPWQQKKGNTRKCRPNQGKELDYKTMSLGDIKELHKQILMNNTAEKHNVFMWTIDKFLPQTEKFMQELGYELHARIIWDKENGIAPAFTVRYSHEYLLWFYKKGKILMPIKEYRGKYTTVLRERSTTHSKKPEIAYKMIEDMFPNCSKVELFARNTRKGWDSFGDEITK
nr:MAG TPA: N6 adenosine methyltransferase subunit [Caudoviricetes sp.]